MLSLSFFNSSPNCRAQDSTKAESSVPADLKLEELFGEPSGDAVRWMATFLTRNPDWALSVADRTVTLHSFRTTVQGSIEIPRLAAMVESIQGEVRDQVTDIKIEPLLTTWKLSWNASKIMSEDNFELIITMQCNDRPVTLNQTANIKAQADGVVRLPAHRAETLGKSIRYEPQPFKNTVGWWAAGGDRASWNLEAAQPGRYSVAILAGCGRGQGGSSMKASLSAKEAGAESKTLATVEFKAEETGHFQNFQWRTIGEIEVPTAGKYQLSIESVKISKNAAMDVREVQLIRQAQ